VIRVDVRVQERCAHGAALNGQRQPEREHSANHAPYSLSEPYWRS
jgi:hypothetical protein